MFGTLILVLTLVVFMIIIPVKLIGAVHDLSVSDAILPVMFAIIVGVAMMFAVVVITHFGGGS